MREVGKLREEIKAGNRRALARAITLVESTRADHREEALSLMDTLPNNTKRINTYRFNGNSWGWKIDLY